jgi:hypothetical protein
VPGFGRASCPGVTVASRPVVIRLQSVEAATIENELGTLLEHLLDRPVGLFGMEMRLGPSDAYVSEPVVQFVITLEAQAQNEEAHARLGALIP